MNQRAITYRKLHNIPESWGTAVNVQAMVFGNMGDDRPATGVAFTRNPSTGERVLRRVPHQRAGRGRRRRHPHAAGNQRSGAQGSGLRQAVDGIHVAQAYRRARSASTTFSSATTATCRTSSSPSSRVSSGCCRRAPASVPRRRRCASRSSLANEGLISKAMRCSRIDPLTLDQLLHPTIDPKRASAG